MSSANDFRKLDSEIQELEQAIKANASVARRTSRVSLGIGVGVIIVIAGFAVLNFVHLKSEMTRKNFSKSLSIEMASMSPLAVAELQKLGQELLPVYAGELKRQLETSWPTVQETLELEMQALTGGLLTHLHSTLAESEQRVLKSVETQVLTCYPSLASEKTQEELRKRLDALCQTAVTNSLERFDSLYSRDLKRVEGTLLKFDVSDSTESPRDLQKKFIHLWLQLLDQEVMEL